jgi:hypothetical protein
MAKQHIVGNYPVVQDWIFKILRKDLQEACVQDNFNGDDTDAFNETETQQSTEAPGVEMADMKATTTVQNTDM